MRVVSISADVKPNRHGKPVATVTVQLANAQGQACAEDSSEVTFTIHESLAYSDTINMEIDGDLNDDDPSVRIHMNDCLIHDSMRNDPPLESPREPDLPHCIDNR